MGRMPQTRRNRPGRPRHVPGDALTDPRAAIRDAATRLFVTKGFADTSTREIAEAVGIRQASLYYHYAGKDEIIAEVVRETIRPTLDAIEHIEELTDDPETALYLLVLLDVKTLADAPHNSGLLGLLPDVAKVLPELRAERAELANQYARLGARIAPARIVAPFGGRWGHQLLQQVEGVITWISGGDFDHGRSGDAIAGSVLRICAANEVEIKQARALAHELWPELESVLER